MPTTRDLRIAMIGPNDTLYTQQFANDWVSEYTQHNIRVLDVAHVETTDDYLLVHESHPVIHLLDTNQELLGHSSITQDYPRIHSEWLAVESDTFERCCDKILQLLPSIPRRRFYQLNGGYQHARSIQPPAYTRPSQATCTLM